MTIKIIYYCIIILIINTGCRSGHKPKVGSLNSIKDLYLDSNTITLTDDGSFWLLYFEPGKVYFDFNPSCGYWFPTTQEGDKIIFKWAMNMNCNFDRGLNRSFKDIKSPEIGKPFGEISLLNDSMVLVKYYYSDWINKVNEAEKKTIDTLFPGKFKVIKL